MIQWGNQAHADEIGKAAGVIFNPAADQCISRTSGEKLLGGVIFQGYTKRSIGMHTAGLVPNWLNRDLLWVCFHYPFVQLGCEVVILQIPSYNDRSIAFVQNLGFRYIARVPDVFPEGDLLIYSMRKRDCRWLDIRPRNLGAKLPDGQQVFSASAA